MQHEVGSIPFLVLAGSLLAALAVSYGVLSINPIVASFKNVFIDSYIIAYFDRATWITGCF